VASKQSQKLGLGVTVLVAGCALMLWLLAKPNLAHAPAGAGAESSQAEPPAPSSTALPSVAEGSLREQPKTPPRTAPASTATDLFAGAMPDFMAATHLRVLDKQPLEIPEQKQLYNWGKEHPDDARPQLLLAWDSMNRDWQGIAVRMYRIAYRADRRAKADPSMLRDLLAIASRFDGVEGSESTEVVKEALGGEALPDIDAALDTARAGGDDAAVTRLVALRKAITDH
jgi:hypothetical protein